MHQLVYVSAASTPLLPTELAMLLGRARMKNARLGINGILIHDAGSFLQVLEGEASVTNELFATIERDTRHRRIVVLSRQSVAQAAFSGWSMGFVDRAHAALAALAALPGFKDLSGSFDASTVTEARNKAFYLIEAFSVGRLRQFVDT